MRRYVPASDAWEPFAEMPASRSSFDAAVLGGRIYAVGGWAIDGDQEHTTFATDMAVYDGSAWSVEAVPFTRRALAVVATSSAIVAIGGMEGSRDVSTAVDVYDPATHAWTSGPAFPGEGFGMAAAAIGDVVYASGSDGTLWRWSVGEPAWTVVRAMVQPRFFHRLVPVEDALWAIGGIGSMTTDGRARLIEAIPTSPGEGASVGWTEISFPGRARNRFAMFAEGDSLYVVGGNDSPAQHDFAPTNFVDEALRLHLPSLRWFSLAPLAEGRQSMEPIRLDDDTVALVGGFGHGGSSARTFADAFVGPGEGTFPITRDVLAEGRTQFGWAVWDGAVWLVAGLVFDEALPAEEQFHHLRDVIRCPITEGAGVPFGPCEATGLELPGTRRAFASARVGSRLYVVGGMREDFAPVDDCAVLDLEARSFSALACPAHVRISATMLEHDGALYLVGGSARAGESLAPDRSIERFDPGTGSWSTVVEELPFDTHQGRWAFAGERLVMLATQAEAGHATLAMVELPH